ncbi:hypothetical protein FPV67DRAFT_1451501 [Lyophyllum atratum]|nr:hypothetical protein FPV67DRAFT_1451501 [Lyophyllum atratum]
MAAHSTNLGTFGSMGPSAIAAEFFGHLDTFLTASFIRLKLEDPSVLIDKEQGPLTPSLLAGLSAELHRWHTVASFGFQKLALVGETVGLLFLLLNCVRAWYPDPVFRFSRHVLEVEWGKSTHAETPINTRTGVSLLRHGLFIIVTSSSGQDPSRPPSTLLRMCLLDFDLGKVFLAGINGGSCQDSVTCELPHGDGTFFRI